MMKNKQSLGTIKCIKGQTAVFSCLNQMCQNQAFVCQSQECQCYKQHEDCLMAKIHTIVKSLKAKIISTKQLEDCVSNGIDKCIHQLSDFRDQMIIKIKSQFSFWGVNQTEKRILSHLKEGKSQKITGRQMWQAHLNFKKQEAILKQQQKIISNINKTLQSFENEIKKPCNQVQMLVQQLNKFSVAKLKSNLKTVIQKEDLEIYATIIDISNLKILFNELMQSKIINSHQEKILISNFFSPKIIKSCKLLYKASQSGFDVGRFHEKCDNIPNTLTLCETEFGKKIGGYTPIPWKSGSDSYVRDESGESFVFSLSNKDKFILQDKGKAVQYWNNNSYGPCFGSGCDFVIYQKSNQNNSSYSSLNHSYINNKYKQGDKESWQRFNGNPQGLWNFKVKEWEVWEIQFQN